MATGFYNWRNTVYPAWTVLAALLLVACSSGDDGDNCGTVAQNRRVHLEMLDNYYWYDRVPESIDYRAFASPAATLEFLRYAALDRFSYVTSRRAFENFFNDGTYIGYGFGFGIEAAGAVRLRFVYTQSPAGLAGLERGDEILAVDGRSASSISAADGWGSVFGPAEAGLPVALQLRRRSGAVETVNLVKNTVTINTVLHSEVIDSGGGKIGYLVYNNFLGTSAAELDPVFAGFDAAGVDRLVLDLRYNGGGSVGVARDLASRIRETPIADSDLFVELRFNQRNRDADFRFYLQPRADSLALDRVTVITTEATCSASEQVISGLKPFLAEVTTVGATTCGKPVGQRPYDFCDSTLVAVNFASYNAAGQGEYFSGLAPDCAAVDDLRFGFGDPAEPLLQTARFQVDNAVCPPARPGGPASPPRSPPLTGLQALVGAV